jgi:hypothetical protein
MAIQYLRRAVLLGYGTDLLDSDPDLATLRDDAEFKQLKALTLSNFDAEPSD